MQFLEEKDIGFDVGVTKVPLVCQSDLFDLTVADPHCRPDKAMGYEACKNAYLDNYQDGNFGVGTGATVGKFKGMDFCMKPASEATPYRSVNLKSVRSLR